MPAPSEQQVLSALATIVDPDLGRDVVSLGMIKDLRISNAGDVAFTFELTTPACPVRDRFQTQAEEAIGALAGVSGVSVRMTANVRPGFMRQTSEMLPGVKQTIAVASGKGGVGKSTTAVNLALALAAEGAQVGVLDADIYGPSQPMMLGITGRPGGPMVTQALEQLLKDTNWRDLDYLIVDMPPGTGDIQLTLAQKVPVTGAVIVTTPQDIALIDARKGLKMFEKVGVPIVGIVENMSMHICSNCGHAEAIFGQGGAERMCKDYNVPFLGGLPLDIRIREQADSGRPTVVADPDGKIAAIYKEIARKTAIFVAQKAEDFSGKFPNIVIQNT